MNKEQIKGKIKDLASGLKDWEGNPISEEITYFQQGEELIIPATSDSDIFSESRAGKTRGRGTNKGTSEEGEPQPPVDDPDGPSSPTDDPEGPQGEDEPKDGEGEGDDEGDGQGGEGDDGEGDKKRTQIRVGDKVRIKGTNQEGVVTEINEDGTYRVGTANFADGGETGDVLGNYEEEELEVISESKGSGEGEREDKEGEDKEGEDGEGKEGEGKPKKGKSGPPPPVRPPDPTDGPEPEGEPGPPQPPPPPGPQGLPPQLPTLNVYDLKERLRRVKNTDFKFPNFAKSFYNADLSAVTSPYVTENMEMDFTYFDKAKMALYHIYAKNIYERKFKGNDAQNFLWLISKYDSHLRFLTYSIDRSSFKIAENQFFKIDLTKKVMSNAMFQILVLPDIMGGGMADFSNDEVNDIVSNAIGGGQFTINLEEMTISASLQNMENILNDCPDIIDESNPNYKDVFLTLITLDALDNIIVRDDGYYKFVSLLAFVNQDLFNQYWLESNLNFMFKFFNTSKLAFTNLKPYNQFFLVDDMIERLTIAMETENKNLNTWNVIKVEIFGQRDQYRVYKGTNLRLRTDADITDEASIENISLTFADKLLISEDIKSFYISVNNILSTESRKQCYKNLQNIFNLQLNSYMDFLNELDSQTYLTYQI